MKTATQIVWEAAGEPAPCNTAGIPLPRSTSTSVCAKCGAPAQYGLDQFISSNFVPTRNSNRIGAFGGKLYCAACVFCARTLRLRCISWIASATGVQFFQTRPESPSAPRPDALPSILDPPAPPFVIGIPLYGIAHGGENNWRRAWWPTEPLPSDPLIKLQSKHVAIYARPSFSQYRYPVQVDDQEEFLLDRGEWLSAREDALVLLRKAVNDGTKDYPARLSLRSLQLPKRASVSLAKSWRDLCAPLMRYHEANWWPLFCELIQVPMEADYATTRC